MHGPATLLNWGKKLPLTLAVLFLHLIFLNTKAVSQDNQSYLKGKLQHRESKEPIAFAHVYFQNLEKLGTVSDVKGEFRLSLNGLSDTVIVSHVGFEKMKLTLSEFKNNPVINLYPKAIEIDAFTFLAGENPALNILRKAIANKPSNNPDNLDAYKYNTYNKLVFTLDGLEDEGGMDSRIDSLLEGGHLFISESYSEVLYKKPGKKNETVKASKMSGIKSPVIGFVSSAFQPFSLYQDHVTVFDIPYLNPLSKDGLKKYDYFLEDSIQTQIGYSYVISFQPQKGKGYLLGNGMMTISSKQYALENMVFKSIENGSNLQFEIQQKNSWNGQHWFPEQMNSKYLLIDTDIEGRKLKLINQNFISDVFINPDIKAKDINPVAMVFDIQNERFPMENFRQDSLTHTENLTYFRFDNLDDKTLNLLNSLSQITTKLSTGRIPLGPIDALTNRFFRINQHEGFALGLGISSNQRLSERFRTEGYFRYGIKDKAWKYGAGIETILRSSNDSKLTLFYSQDIAEIGHVPFIKTNTFSRTSDIFREFLAERMDHVERFSFEFSQIPRRNWRIGFTGSIENRQALWANDLEIPLENTLLAFRSAEIGLNFRYMAREISSKIGNIFLSGPVSYPVFQMHLSRALPEILESNTDYWRMAFKMQQQWKKGISLNRVQISGFATWGESLPISMMNTGFGIRPQERNVGINLPGYLQTMRIYEFLSDRIIHASYSHLTGPLFNLKTGFATSSPQLNLIQSFAIGNVTDRDIAAVLGFNTMEKGYFESGIEAQNLIKYKSGFGFQGIGIGTFYRWGPYSNPAVKDNLVVNLSLTTTF